MCLDAALPFYSLPSRGANPLDGPPPMPACLLCAESAYLDFCRGDWLRSVFTLTEQYLQSHFGPVLLVE